MEALLSEDALVSSEEAAAFNEVIHDFRLTGLDEWRAPVGWSFYLRVPSDERVVLLGPITGEVDRCGRPPTPAELASMHAAPNHLNPRFRERQKFRVSQAGYSDGLAEIASRCPWPELVEALCGQEPDWGSSNPPGFDPVAFNAHLRTVFSSPIRWNPRVYCVSNRARQTLVDFAAAMGGRVRTDQVAAAAERMGVTRADASRCSIVSRESKSPLWPPPVKREGPWSVAEVRPFSEVGEFNELVSVTCPRCTNPATGVVRVPEVPAALLCRTCLVQPDCPELVFPRRYADLALPPLEFSADLVDELRRLEPQKRSRRGSTRTSKPRAPKADASPS
jgi:hypothetical protein